MGRAPCCDKGKVKKGPWSPEEDAILKTYLEKHGTSGNWIALPHKAGLNRCGKSCRLRWLNYLRPDIKHGGFTDEEDSVILTLYSNIGSRWSIIASHLPGRTDNDVKNYWNTKLKKKLNHNINNNNNNNNVLVQKIGDSDSSYSSTSLQDNSIVMDVDYHHGQNYLNFGQHNEELNYFDQAIIGQLSSYNYSVSDINIGTKGNYASSSSSNMNPVSSSPSTLGFFHDNSFATWSNGNDNINNISSYYYGGVKSDHSNGVFMEYMGFDSRSDDALLSDFGF